MAVWKQAAVVDAMKASECRLYQQHGVDEKNVSHQC